MDSASYERYLDFEPRVLHRISSRIYRAEWLGQGSNFEKIACVGFISPNAMFMRFGDLISKIILSPTASSKWGGGGLEGGAPRLNKYFSKKTVSFQEKRLIFEKHIFFCTVYVLLLKSTHLCIGLRLHR